MTAKKKTTRRAKQPAAKKNAKHAAPEKRAGKRPQAGTPTVGATVERTFKGTKHAVQGTAEGYLYKGTAYRTLTAVAKAITGYKSISGPRFFGTDEAGKAKGGAR